MKTKLYIVALVLLCSMPIVAQILNFPLRTNNQQLIDEALGGVFVKLDRSYELCDTVNDEHYGRDGKDYFSKVSFIGIRTEKGIVFPSCSKTPWEVDKDFDEYKGVYKPLAVETIIAAIGLEGEKGRVIDGVWQPSELSDNLCLLTDSAGNAPRISVDTIAGVKKGWVIWLSADKNSADVDSVKLTSIREDLEIPTDGMPVRVESLQISEHVYGGVYVTLARASAGHIVLALSGILVHDEDEWVLEFPFLAVTNDDKTLTPIPGLGVSGNNPIIMKKK